MKKYISYYSDRFIVRLLIMMTLFSGMLLKIVPKYASAFIEADSITEISEGCSFTGTVTSVHTTTINPGSSAENIGTTKITTVCANSANHQIYAIGYSDNTDGNTNLIGSGGANTIPTGIGTGNVSNWSMKIAKDDTSYLPDNLTIENGFNSYHVIPSSVTMISSYTGGTDSSTGSSITTGYRVKVSDYQTDGSYVGKVKFTLTATMVYSITIKTSPGISKVTLNGTECTNTSGCVVELTEGQSYNLVATTATGYDFTSWDAGANGSVANNTSATTSYMVGGGDSTITPTATAKTYTITLNGNGATTAGSTSATVNYGATSLSSITVPQRKYTVSGFYTRSSNNSSDATISSTSTLTSTYTFKGWYKESGATNKIASNATTPALEASTTYTNSSKQWTYTTASAVTLYAGWTSASVTLPTITKAGYTCGWTETSSGASSITYASGASLTPTKNYTLYGVCVFAGPDIQNLSASSCTTTPSYARDNRDGHVYTVQRLKDGKCWMMENLDLGRNSLTTDLTSSNTNLSSTVTASTFNSWRRSGSSTFNYDQGRFIPISGSDSTTGTPYGTIYNYHAATAGTISGYTNANNAQYDICPAGWRLPTGGSSGEFNALYNQYHSYALMRAPIAENGFAFAFPGGVFSGGPNNAGTVTKTGERGYLWSSTRPHDQYMYSLDGRTNDSYIGLSSESRDFLSSIRCVRK